MTDLDLTAFAPQLRDAGDGRWLPPRGDEAVSYPLDAQDDLAGVEEGSFWFVHRREVVVTLLRQLPPRGVVIDVGGGNGFMTAALRRAGFPCVLLEPGATGAGNALGRGLAPVIQATFDQAGFGEKALPAVGLFDVLEHIADDRELLRRVARALAPGGRVYLTVPASRLLWSASDELAGHRRRYSRTALREVLRQADLTVEWLGGFFAPLWPALLLARAIPYRLGRRETTVAAEMAAHRPREGPLVSLMRMMLGAELRLIRAGARLPVGASWLAVAARR